MAEPIQRLYRVLTRERGEPACDDIPEAACDDVPRNFLTQLGARLLTKTGDLVSQPGLVMVWLLSALAAPGFLIAALAPVREAGSLLPQIIIGGATRRLAVRKWVWSAGSATQGAAVAGIGLTGQLAREEVAGWIVLALLALFSVGRSACSVTSKDLLGKTIPKGRRGSLGGWAASTTGVVALGVGALFTVYGGEDLGAAAISWMLVGAGALWVVAALVMSTVREPAGGASGSDDTWREVWRGLRLLGTQPAFRRFCIARALLSGTVLSMPFYVLLAKRSSDASGASFGLLMVAGSLASTASGVTWGRLADRSSRRTLGIAGVASAVVGVATAAAPWLELEGIPALALFGGLFFSVSLGHTGIRLGRKTYLVDLAPPDEKGIWVAVSNTIIGIGLLAAGALGGLVEWIGASGVILIYALAGAAGGLVAFTLPEIHEAAGREGKSARGDGTSEASDDG